MAVCPPPAFWLNLRACSSIPSQLALAWVFVLVAIGNILNFLSGWLGRIVDRVFVLDRRIHLNTQPHLLLVASGLAVGATVAVLFLEEMLGYALERLVAAATLLVHEDYLETRREP